MASLALAWMDQDRELRVRQREELRRALTAAAEYRGWAATGENSVASAIKDVNKLTKVGSKVIAEELAEELADKKVETAQLREVAESIHELAGNGDWEDPIEVSYCHTVRDGDGLATKTQILTLADATEAKDAAAVIERKIDSWEKLRAQMQDHLKLRQKKVKEMEGSIPDFAESSKGLVDDVLAILH